MAGNSARPGVSVTSRVLALLGAFDERHRELTLTDLARRADVPVPTAHRLVGELVAGGALARRPSGEYVVGRRLWDVGLLAPVEAGLRRVAEPFLHDIHAATRATVHLAVRDGDEALYLERMSGRSSAPVISQIGSTLPLHCTGVGKVLLAHAPEEVQVRVLGALARVTRYTITQPGLLRQQLTRVRRAGCATTT
jgi:DNA-binding IclR family transcriptional regulator